MADPKCFLSYSWESAEHRQWVLSLARALQERGVYVHLDQWDVRPGMDLPRYMEECVRESDHVLLICTPTFAEKANKGLGGVGYEKSIVTGEIFTQRSNDTKFIPILRVGSAKTALPSYLQSKVFLDFKDNARFPMQIEELLRHLHDEHVEVRLPLGPKPTFGRTSPIHRVESRIETIGWAPAVSKKLKSAAASQEMTANRTAQFDIDLFKRLRDFAYSSDGLDLSTSAAAQWAEEHVSDVPGFDVEEFRRLKAFAYGSDGLNLSSSAAAQWATEHVSDAPRFDVSQFRRLRDFAYSSDGLDLSTSAAAQWAGEHVNDAPGFDVEEFRRLKAFAYGSDGLNLSSSAATQWALDKLKK